VLFLLLPAVCFINQRFRESNSSCDIATTEGPKGKPNKLFQAAVHENARKWQALGR